LCFERLTALKTSSQREKERKKRKEKREAREGKKEENNSFRKTTGIIY